ncbi:unnamed protein product, partial [Brassica oleracea]
MVVASEETRMITETNREMVAAEGLVLSSTTAVVTAAGEGRETTLPPMMKLAMCCAVKEAEPTKGAGTTKGAGSSKSHQRAPESSSEGSTTEGG